MITLDDIDNAIDDVYGDKYIPVRNALRKIAEYLRDQENKIMSPVAHDEIMDDIMFTTHGDKI